MELGIVPFVVSDTAPDDIDVRSIGQRQALVASHIESRGVRDPRVLAAMRHVPRHEFVPEQWKHLAYRDQPLPIGYDQTISQPYIVALMSESLVLQGDEIILEVGTGSGYQAAVLCELAAQVYTIEIVPQLAQRAEDVLRSLGYDNVHVRAGDGYHGWPEHAPFDAIMLTAAPELVPEPLLSQLKPGGRLVLPVGNDTQHLVRMTRNADGFSSDTLATVRFVPMTGEAQRK